MILGLANRARARTSLPVLVIGDLLQPVDVFSAEGFLNSDVRHGRRWRSAVPMLQARRKPHHIAGADFLDRSALALHPSETGGDDQRLAERMRVPGRPGSGFEGDLAAAYPPRVWSLEERIHSDRTGEPVGIPLRR